MSGTRGIQNIIKYLEMRIRMSVYISGYNSKQAFILIYGIPYLCQKYDYTHKAYRFSACLVPTWAAFQ